MTDTTQYRYLRPRLTHAAVLFVSCGLLISIPACKKHSEGDGHDHGKQAAKDQHAEGDGHDHGAAEHADEVKLSADAIERYGVKIGDAQMWILKPTFIAPARVGFNTEAMAHVGSPLRGRAVEIKVRQGDQVKKGDPLVIVESPELGQAQADFLLKRTAAEAAGPQVELAKASWDRANGLLEKSEGISLTDVQRREAEYKAAIAAQKSAQGAASAAENGLHILGMSAEAVAEVIASGEVMPRHTIRAAIDGKVVLRDLTQGELVGPDRESLMVLADTTILWVLVDVPEARLMSVAVGAKAWVTIGTVSAGSGAAVPGARKFEGQVAFISPLVDPITRTAQVRIEIPSSTPDGATLRPGMFAQAEIVGGTPDGSEPTAQIAVPQEAVQTVEGAPSVFVPAAGEPNTFQKRALTVGPTVGGLVPVFAGLVDGEKYVEAGSFILKAELAKGSAKHEH